MPATPFQRVLTRLTSAEMKAILTAQGLLTGSGNDPSSEQTGEAALSWYDWNEGAGTYSSTSPSYRYRGGRYVNTGGGETQRGRDIRALLETAYNADPTTFLAPLTVLRRTEVTDIANPETSTVGASSKVVIWNQTQYSGVTAPAALAIMLPLELFYNSATPNYTGATAATALALKPAGQRCIKMGAYSAPNSAFWSIPTSSADTNNVYRGAVFNRDFDTYYRHGMLVDTWHAAMLDANSVWRTFWEDLRSNGGADIIDHLILDANEIIQPFFHSVGSPTLLIRVITALAVSIDTGTEVLTATGHAIQTGQPIMLSSDSSALPTASNVTINSTTIVTLVLYARAIDANTFTLHLTAAGALANTGTVNFSTAGTSVKVNGYRETLDNWFLDPDWETARTTILKPVLDQSVWNGYATWGIHADERTFLFNAAYEKYLGDKWADVLQIALDEFPNLKIADYGAGLRCPATRSVYSAPGLLHFPYSSGKKIGNLSSHSNYAIYDRRVWKWSNLATTDQPGSGMTTAELSWATFVQGVASVRTMLAADPDNCELWIAPTQDGINIPEDDALYSDFLLHMVLPSASRIGFYNSAAISENPTVTQQTLAINLIAERDAVVAYTPAVLDPQDDLDADYTRDVITTRVWAGGRWVWRVTPRPAATTTITQNADGVRFVCDSEVLAIGNGRIVNLPSSYASLGYWVVETVSDTPPYPDASVETAITYRRTSTTEITYTTKRPAETVYSRS